MATLIPASRVEIFDVPVPAGTAKAAPLELPTPFGPGELVGAEVFIPDGHNGLTGLRLLLAHSQAIPRTQDAWIVGNDEKIEWSLVGYPSTGAWSAQVFNTDIYPHTFHVRFLVADFAYTQAQAGPAAQTTPPFS